MSPFGGLVLTGKAADLKSAGSNPMGVRIPRPPLIGNRIQGAGYGNIKDENRAQKKNSENRIKETGFRSEM